jgi:L-cysteine/cystine lyase
MHDPTGSMRDAEKIAAIRAELPATQAYAYLNTGTCGPMPRRTYEALATFARSELEEGRIRPAAFARFFQTYTDAREALAALLGCDPLDIALTHSTTEGINIALMGLDWRSGDEIVTAATEHPGVLHPVYLLHQRYGVRIRMTEIGAPGRHVLAELRSALTPKTRAVVLSHVCWTTGMVLPFQEIAAEAHRAGALVICDAAQAAGMVPSRVLDLGADAYACSGQKWLCGSDGTGGLFVRRDRLGDFQQTFIGYLGIQHDMADREGNFVPTPGAARYQAGSFYHASVAALSASLRWIADEVGWTWAHQRIAALGRSCREALARVKGVTIITPAEQMAGLVHFTVEGIAPADLSAKLSEAGFAVRNTPYPPAVRVSTGFYNTEDEIDRLAAAVAAIASS